MPIPGYVDPVERSCPAGIDSSEWYHSQVAKYARLAAEAFVNMTIRALGVSEEQPDGYMDCMIEFPGGAMDGNFIHPAELHAQEGAYLGQFEGLHYAANQHGNLFWNENGVDGASKAFADARLVTVWSLMYRRIDMDALRQFITLE